MLGMRESTARYAWVAVSARGTLPDGGPRTLSGVPSSRPTPQSAAEWGAVIPIYLGMAGLIACFVVWVMVDRVEALLVTGFGGLILGGQGVAVASAVRSGPTPQHDADGTAPEAQS